MTELKSYGEFLNYMTEEGNGVLCEYPHEYRDNDGRLKTHKLSFRITLVKCTPKRYKFTIQHVTQSGNDYTKLISYTDTFSYGTDRYWKELRELGWRCGNSDYYKYYAV